GHGVHVPVQIAAAAQAETSAPGAAASDAATPGGWGAPPAPPAGPASAPGHPLAPSAGEPTTVGGGSVGGGTMGGGSVSTVDFTAGRRRLVSSVVVGTALALAAIGIVAATSGIGAEDPGAAAAHAVPS